MTHVVQYSCIAETVQHNCLVAFLPELMPQRSQGGTLENHMPTAPLLKAKQTLLALSTWPAPTNQPRAIGKP